MKLLQLHWQWIEKGETVKTEMRSQIDRDKMTHKDFRAWVKEIQRDHPCPIDAVWMVCEESSRWFTKTMA